MPEFNWHGDTLELLDHPYNTTIRNERAIEVPIGRWPVPAARDPTGTAYGAWRPGRAGQELGHRGPSSPLRVPLPRTSVRLGGSLQEEPPDRMQPARLVAGLPP